MASSGFKAGGNKHKQPPQHQHRHQHQQPQRVRFESQTPSPDPYRKGRPATPHPEANLPVNVSPPSPQAATAPLPSNAQPAPPPTKTAATLGPSVQAVNTHTNPALGTNPTFTHFTTTGASTGSVFHQPLLGVNPGFQTLSNTTAGGLQPVFVSYGNQPFGVPVANMADYQNAAPPNAGVNFQPQVPDTTQGPFVGTYTPRQDNPGLVYIQPGQPVFQVSLNHQSSYALQPDQPPVTSAVVWQPQICPAMAFHASGTAPPSTWPSPSHRYRHRASLASSPSGSVDYRTWGWLGPSVLVCRTASAGVRPTIRLAPTVLAWTNCVSCFLPFIAAKHPK